MKYILTHPGTRHADETLAIVHLWNQLGVIPVRFSYTPTEDEFNDPEIIVLDIGRRYQPSLNNFDHHHDPELPATNLLVLRHFPLEPKVQEKIERYLFDYVDKVDRGDIVEKVSTDEVFRPTFNSAIRNCNAISDDDMEVWDAATSIAIPFYKAALAAATKSVADEGRWNTEVTKYPGYAIHNSTDPITGWQGYAEEDNIFFLLTPNKRGGWQIISRDSINYKIPYHPDQTFLHNSGFLAAYETMVQAENHVLEIIYNK